MQESGTKGDVVHCDCDKMSVVIGGDDGDDAGGGGSVLLN